MPRTARLECRAPTEGRPHYGYCGYYGYYGYRGYYGQWGYY